MAFVSRWYTGCMTETTDHLGKVRAAAVKLRRAERTRTKAVAALADAIRAAEAAQIRPGAIIEASGLPRASFYRLKGGQ
jgi:hypothetical protein